MQEWIVVKTRKTRTKTNQQVRKAEDEDQANDTSEETVDKKDSKKFTVRFVRGSHQVRTSVQCVTSLFMLFVEVTVKTEFRTKNHLQPLCKEESNQH